MDLGLDSRWPPTLRSVHIYTPGPSFVGALLLNQSKQKKQAADTFQCLWQSDVSVLAAVARDVDSSWPSVLDGGIGTAPDDDYRYIIAMSASKTQANFVSMGSL